MQTVTSAEANSTGCTSPIPPASRDRCGTFVIYSDDFGRTWGVLGSPAVAPLCRSGRSKVEELPTEAYCSAAGMSLWRTAFSMSSPMRMPSGAQAAGDGGDAGEHDRPAGQRLQRRHPGRSGKEDADGRRLFVALSPCRSRTPRQCGLLLQGAGCLCRLFHAWRTGPWMEERAVRDGRLIVLFDDGQHEEPASDFSYEVRGQDDGYDIGVPGACRCRNHRRRIRPPSVCQPLPVVRTPLPHVAADQQGGLPPVCGTGADKAAGCRLLPFRQSAERSGPSTTGVYRQHNHGGPRHISREGLFLQCRYDMQQDAEDTFLSR